MLLFFWDGKSRDEQNVAGDVVNYGKVSKAIGFYTSPHPICTFNYIHLDPYTIQWMVCFEKDYHLEISPEQRKNQYLLKPHDIMLFQVVWQRKFSPLFQSLPGHEKNHQDLDLFLLVIVYFLPWVTQHQTSIWENICLELFPGIFKYANPRRWFYFSPIMIRSFDKTRSNEHVWRLLSKSPRDFCFTISP